MNKHTGLKNNPNMAAVDCTFYHNTLRTFFQSRPLKLFALEAAFIESISPSQVFFVNSLSLLYVQYIFWVYKVYIHERRVALEWELSFPLLLSRHLLAFFFV